MVTELQGTVLDFAQSGTELLPLDVSRRAFVLFMGTVALLLMIYGAVSRETFADLTGTALTYGPTTAIVMTAAGKAWDRYAGMPADEDDDA
ncbi:hypothetical protein AB0454_38505 [Streptomyces sp. NPDC093509]|uniref:hypothetical protein n=1 Tax=Streptomyces sp. NPDC093509 TaxID=3154982 RepID=UPI00344E2280